MDPHVGDMEISVEVSTLLPLFFRWSVSLTYTVSPVSFLSRADEADCHDYRCLKRIDDTMGVFSDR